MERTPFLELIPRDEFSSEQRAFRCTDTSIPPLYRLLQEPTHLQDIILEKSEEYRFSIWRENGTILCIDVSPPFVDSRSIRLVNNFDEEPDLKPLSQLFWERSVCFAIPHGGAGSCVHGVIYGKTDAALAETATFFWSLGLDGKRSHLNVYNHSTDELAFDFAVLQAEQLAKILDSNPKRSLSIQGGVWTSEQAVVLASRPYPINLSISKSHRNNDSFRFKDGGSAFVDALQRRQSSFGTLAITETMPFSRTSLEQLSSGRQTIETLSIGFLQEDCALVPLSTKVNLLRCYLQAKYGQRADLDVLAVAAKELECRIYLDSVPDWDVFLVCLFNRLAKASNLEKFHLSIDFSSAGSFEQYDVDRMSSVVDALISVLRSNSKLYHLDLCEAYGCLGWDPYLRHIFNELEGHQGIRLFAIDTYPSEDPDFSWLVKLLSRNRKIKVVDASGKTKVPEIEKLYALNQFYCDSDELKKECYSVRPSLMALALRGSEVKDFQRCALMLSQHTDTLCELVRDVSQETTAFPCATTGLDGSAHRKRKMRVQPHPAAKKGARSEV